MKFFIKTFGCQMNVNDSEKINHILAERGMVRTEEAEDADIVIINSCAVREKAQEKIFSFIGRLDQRQKIVVSGCVAQSEKDLILKRNKKVDFVVGTHQFYGMNGIIDDFLLKNIKGTDTDLSKEWSESVPDIYARENRFTGFISIMEGCDNFCTYCIVPFTRGREKYRPYKNILDEVEYLAGNGFREIVLLGQNVNSWKDQNEGVSFAALLDRIAGIEKIKWIRFITSYPGYYESELIDVMKHNRNIARHIHFPVQSGSTRILKKMGRNYTREQYMEIISKFKSEIPEIKFSSDFIVGFPGETDRDFDLTLSLIEKARYDSIFSFIYSPRKHTKAALIDDNISLEIKKERLQLLHELQKKIQLEDHGKLVGKELEVMVTGKNPKREGELLGRTESYKIVTFPGNRKPGEFIKVTIDRFGPHSLRGIEVI